MEEGQVRLDFGADGGFHSATERSKEVLGSHFKAMTEMISFADGVDAWSSLHTGHPYFGRLYLSGEQGCRTLDGSISPIRNSSGQVARFVVLGNDVTAAEQELEKEKKKSEEMAASQSNVVTQLQNAMRSLSEGTLTVRLSSEFSENYEGLRNDFNTAVSALDAAIGAVLEGTDQLGLEVGDVGKVVDDFAKRTEHQAATLEETSSAISELSKSVAGAASGAKGRARRCADCARSGGFFKRHR